MAKSVAFICIENIADLRIGSDLLYKNYVTMKIYSKERFQIYMIIELLTLKSNIVMNMHYIFKYVIWKMKHTIILP